MAGWFGTPAAVVEFDKQIEEATSSSLSNLALNLEIADTIRSKTIPPKSAMQSLKKRLNNTKNPNIQLSTLELIDQSVKNGGTHFMQEIASREFMDNLVSLIKYDDGRGGMGEREVRTKMLELIQTWAGAAQGRESLSYITEVYRSLQSQGFNFPPQEDVASALFDSNAPPEWTDSESGGGEGLQSPSSVKRTLWEGRESSMVGARSSSLNQGYPGMMQPRSSRVEQDTGFDADLKRALEMSLEDSKGQGGAGYVPQVPVQSKSAQQTNGSSAAKAPETKKHIVEDGELDADLEAAIAASLKDMETQKTRHARELKDRSTSASAAPPAAAQYRPNNQFELTPVEGENINLFATLVDRLQHQPPGTILREPQIQELYESIGTLRPKLARTYGETMSKHDTLLDLHSKLSTVVRYYDRMLEERMANAYAGGAARYGQPQRNSMYPSLPPAGMARPMDVGPTGGVESYYSGGAPEYAQQQAPTYSGYPPQQQRMSGYGAPPPAQEANYYQQQTPQQQHQSPYPTLPQQNAAPYPSEPQQQPPMHRRPSQQAYSQTSSQYAPSHTSQSSNPAISSPAPADPQFYYEQQQQQQPPSPEIYHQPPPQQQAPPPQQQQPYPTQPPQQLQQPPGLHRQGSHQHAPQQPPQYYAQSQPQQQRVQRTEQQQQWPQAPATGQGYGQEAFPQAPQHVLAPVAVKEESLIEL
ncbi:Vacuolar protein-sorting-associated protein 27 [Elasticomyces elasticus]|nr:Vacuolar protein-sorting-associated protein 27 [Elasticomyces elasticus]KAK3643647.1 Vacuolar protein-sorting-associated protein 27 [Elasticomyces elasticus]KAK4915181.1 Vacuolar protein-sorting-associated protein 27 [Elasticomyces elasticus]KAK5744474.1 Vacuolar protein-sorting-associated protein 27 [Elasticomyces elasticus]